MDKYRLVPNDKQYYTDNSYGMNYQYNSQFYEEGEQSDPRPSSQFQYGDGRMPGMLAYDPSLSFANDESLLLDSDFKKSLDYVQHLQQQQQLAAQNAQASGRKVKKSPKTKGATQHVVDKKIKKNGKGAGKPQQAASAGQRVMKNEGDNELEVKRMKRLLRNRVSAQLARERKKQYVLGLEKKSKESDKKIKDLQDMVKALTKENELLKVQLEQHQQAKVGTAMVPES